MAMLRNDFSAASSGLSRRELDRYFQLSMDLMGVMTAGDGCWVQVNPAFRRILGWDPLDLLSTCFLDLLHPDDTDGARAAISSLTDGGLLAQFETRVRCREGGVRRVAWQAWSDQGRDLLYCSGHDVPHRRLDEDRLNANLLDIVTDAVIALDLEQRVTFWNPAAERMYGWSAAEAMGRDIKTVLQPAGSREQIARAIDRLNAGHTLRGEYRHRRRDGGELWVEATTCAVHDADRRLLGYVTVNRDVSDRKAAEQELHRVREELEKRVADRTTELQQRATQLAQMASQLTLAEQRERRRLAQVLHDYVQQLLVGAKFGVDVLRRRVSADQIDSVERVGRLLDESISASRSLSVELSPPILHEAGLAAGLEWLARWMKDTHGLEVGLHIQRTAAAEREDVRALLYQAVRELLFNIVKHANVSEASIELAMHDRDNLRVTVVDRGRGFNSERISSAAYQVGDGVGLFSIRERLAMLGGRMEIYSAVGHGARFVLIAPVHEDQKPGTPHVINLKRGLPRRAAYTERALRPHQGIRIMLVDDHEVVRQGLMSLLSEEPDFDVVAEASNGAEAVEQARAVEPDVVLMDFSMPVMDGVEATRRMHHELPHVKVIGLSMYQEPDRSAAMMEAGAAAYLTKSGETNVLIETIRNICRSGTA